MQYNVCTYSNEPYVALFKTQLQSASQETSERLQWSCFLCPALSSFTSCSIRPVCHMLHTQDVLVSQQHRVVDLSLSEPGLLVSGGEDFDGDAFPLPLTPPHFTVTTLTWKPQTQREEENRYKKCKGHNMCLVWVLAELIASKKKD